MSSRGRFLVFGCCSLGAAKGRKSARRGALIQSLALPRGGSLLVRLVTYGPCTAARSEPKGVDGAARLSGIPGTPSPRSGFQARLDA